jgi:hypothetical protein
MNRNLCSRALEWLRRTRVRLACLIAVAVFLSALARFYDPKTGFTSLVSIGAKIGEPVNALRQVPHYVYEDSYGYDGAYYIQLALHPLLDEPELARAIDNVPYRAKRILICWAAWLAGLGQPPWIVKVYPMLNIACWLALAALLWRWFPPDNWENFLRWAAVLFSHGVCMSVRHSLPDLPSLLLVAVVVVLVEKGRTRGGVAALALAALCKETSLLAGAAFAQPPLRGLKRWGRLAGLGTLTVLPLVAWLVYVRWKAGPTADQGVRALTWPLLGLAEKWGVIAAEISYRGWRPPHINSFCATMALTIQAGFLLLRWRTKEIWWRIGASFAVLLLLVSEPVWEGYPGAASRVVLPVTLAFNVLLPRGRRWLPLLLLGNLSVLAGWGEFANAPIARFPLKGEPFAVVALQVDPGTGWHAFESKRSRQWRWSAQRGSLKLVNASDVMIMARLSGTISMISPRRVTVVADGTEVWATGPTESKKVRMETTAFRLPPGEHTVIFATDRPGIRGINGDERELAFAVYDLEISVALAPQSP